MSTIDNIAASLCLSTKLSTDDTIRVAGLLLQDLAEDGLVIMPATPSMRLRHEAVKGITGITAAAFGTMWHNLVAYARTQER